MEDLEVTDKYKKGFNHGYLVREQFPKIIKGMSVPENEHSDYTQGFNDGVKQYEREFAREQVRQDLKNRDLNKDRGMDLGR